MPYKGSFFTMALGRAGDIVVAGMKGNAYHSGDKGKTFSKVEIPTPVTISVATTLTDGTLLFINQAGQILRSRDQGKTIEVVPAPPLPPTGAIVQEKQGMLSAGLYGVIPFSIEGVSAGNAGGMR